MYVPIRQIQGRNVDISFTETSPVEMVPSKIYDKGKVFTNGEFSVAKDEILVALATVLVAISSCA